MKKRNNIEREPDFKYDDWWFYFDEMIQWNDEGSVNYAVRYCQDTSQLQFFSTSKDRWLNYSCLSDTSLYHVATEAYIQWQKDIEDAILGQDE